MGLHTDTRCEPDTNTCFCWTEDDEAYAEYMAETEARNAAAEAAQVARDLDAIAAGTAPQREWDDVPF